VSRLLLAEVTPRLSRSDFAPALAAEGHEDQFTPLGLIGRYRSAKATFAGTHGNGRDAPKAAVPRAPYKPIILGALARSTVRPE